MKHFNVPAEYIYKYDLKNENTPGSTQGTDVNDDLLFFTTVEAIIS
jgi:hypothetical protein